jgi:hypothetical protein
MNVIEQSDLMGGAELVARTGRVARRLRVDRRWKVGFAAALALVVEHGKREAIRAEVPSMTRCPKCQRLGRTEEDFGTRMIHGERRPQSWCRDCRSRKPVRRTSAQEALNLGGGEWVASDVSLQS